MQNFHTILWHINIYDGFRKRSNPVYSWYWFILFSWKLFFIIFLTSLKTGFYSQQVLVNPWQVLLGTNWLKPLKKGFHKKMDFFSVLARSKNIDKIKLQILKFRIKNADPCIFAIFKRVMWSDRQNCSPEKENVNERVFFYIQ